MNTPDWWIEAVSTATYGVRSVSPGDRWDRPGIKKAVQAMAETVSPRDLMIAFANGAADPKIRTPAGVQSPGPQWAGTDHGAKRVPTACPDHPDIPYTKCECRRFEVAEAKPRPPTFWEVYRAEQEAHRQAQLTDHYTQGHEE